MSAWVIHNATPAIGQVAATLHNDEWCAPAAFNEVGRITRDPAGWALEGAGEERVVTGTLEQAMRALQDDYDNELGGCEGPGFEDSLWGAGR